MEKEIVRSARAGMMRGHYHARPVTVPPPDSPTLITGKGPPARDTGPLTAGEKDSALPRAGAPRTETGEWLDGKFRLMEKLGEGGFGLVYKAEQTQPIHRFVAVKVLKAGMDTRQVIARFETERQSLALMEHPNIARVLDAGETAAGQPYFVMELVRGMSITKHTREKHLPLRARLELFIPVCHAVNHAHQKGIIHRDLKPSNIMVMEEDGAPVPKVIDFGIAKVLEQKDASQTLATGMDQLVGTPGYISPEQIQHGSSHVDTRSDVYALGSILLELLTGKGLVTPMDLAHKPIHLILRDQVDLDPPRPSSRDPDLKGDLDWITLKALEREPARRYGSADDLADDLRRFLDHQPVRARPPSRRYLLEKFVRRHRVGVAASAAIALAVLGGGVTSTALYLQAERNQRLLIKSYSRSDEQMARQLGERADHSEAVARLCRALRTDPENGPAAVNLLSLLQHVHLLHPLTPELPLPEGMTSARLTVLSPQTRRLLALGSVSDDGGKNDTLCVWDTVSQARRDFPLPSGVLATGLLATPDGSHAILTRDDGQVELLTLPSAGRAP
ncbi:MAG TPA: serine/threonine-protein kinase, partial [Prosthecobacter sp.]|nr:serine/threonine-protein kinase [Prosthecobacter sp.]